MSWKRRIAACLVGESVTAALVETRVRLRTEWRLHRIHQTGCAQAKALAGSGPFKLHLGCGCVYKPGWVNIDNFYYPPCRPDLLLDLRLPLPFADASCEAIYSEHFFEHVPFPGHAVKLLQENLRVLRPGGSVSIGVPDPQLVLAAYVKGAPEPYFDYFFTDPHVPRWLNTRMEAINWLFKQGGEHHFIYDYESLEKLLQQAGFTRIARRKFDPERDAPSREHETLYVEAYKPA